MLLSSIFHHSQFRSSAWSLPVPVPPNMMLSDGVIVTKKSADVLPAMDAGKFSYSPIVCIFQTAYCHGLQ